MSCHVILCHFVIVCVFEVMYEYLFVNLLHIFAMVAADAIVPCLPSLLLLLLPGGARCWTAVWGDRAADTAAVASRLVHPCLRQLDLAWQQLHLGHHVIASCNLVEPSQSTLLTQPT
jgi:hypothetical protein